MSKPKPTIHPLQQHTAKQFYDALNDGNRYIILKAYPQSGKSGVIYELGMSFD